MSLDLVADRQEELGSSPPVSNNLYYVIPVLLIVAYAGVRRRLRNRYSVFRGGLLDHPIDFVRRRLTRGLQVSTGAQELRRGDEVETLVTIPSSGGLGDVEVGLVCTEYYDYQETWRDKDGTHTSRETADATAYEAWQPLDSAQGSQSVRLAIPADAPFSYEGECLSFKWDVVAKRHKRHRLDAQVRQEIFVRP